MMKTFGLPIAALSECAASAPLSSRTCSIQQEAEEWDRSLLRFSMRVDGYIHIYAVFSLFFAGIYIPLQDTN